VISEKILEQAVTKKMEKKAAKIIRETRRKERLGKQAKRVESSLTIVERAVH
jgi:hypothetical protein